MVYFAGGGVSWNEETAAHPIKRRGTKQGKPGYYAPHVRFYLEEQMKGLLKADDPRNPFHGWNFIYIPYSTGDLHIGNGDFPYTDEKGRRRVLHHHGERNVRAAMAAAPEAFLQAEQVMVCGESAGAFAAAAWAPEMAAYFPGDSRLIVYADGAQACSPLWPGVAQGVWRANPLFYDCLEKDGQIVRDWFLRIRDTLGARAVCLQSISPYDSILIPYESKMNGGAYELSEAAMASFHRRLSESVQALSKEMPAYSFYIYYDELYGRNGATTHTIARSADRLYARRAGQITVGEWLQQAAQGKLPEPVGGELLCRR